MARTDGIREIITPGSYIKPIGNLGFDMLIYGSNKYINFNTVSGTTGYGFRDNLGVIEFKNALGSWTPIGSGGGGGTWGSITGTLSDQTDLQSALDSKLETIGNGNATTWDGAAVNVGGTITSNIDVRDTTLAGYETYWNSATGSLEGYSRLAVYDTVEIGQRDTENITIYNRFSADVYNNKASLESSLNDSMNAIHVYPNDDQFTAYPETRFDAYEPHNFLCTDRDGYLKSMDLARLVKDADVRGGAVNLNARLGCISNFASPNAGGYVSGGRYDGSFHGQTSTSGATLINTIELAPYYTNTTLTINNIGLGVATGTVGSLARILIYSTDANGRPDAKLFESSDIACNSAGLRTVAGSFAFQPGVQYWIGAHYSAAIGSIRRINISACANLGLSSGVATSYFTELRATVTFGSAPSTWTFSSAQLLALAPVNVRFQVV